MTPFVETFDAGPGPHFTELKAANGTITYPGAHLHSPVGTDAAALRLNYPIDFTVSQTIRIRLRADDEHGWIWFQESATPPVPGPKNPWHAASRGRMGLVAKPGTTGYYLIRRKTASGNMHWDAAAQQWVSPLAQAYAPVNVVDFYIAQIEIDGPTVSMRFQLLDGTGSPLMTTPTSWIPPLGSPLWIVVGDPSTNSIYGSTDVDRVEVA